MDLAARACFEPGAAMTMFTKLGALEKAQGVRIPTFLRTHPQSEARPRAQVAAICSWRGLLIAACVVSFIMQPRRLLQTWQSRTS